ncbi:MAG: hypothetical protein IIY91_06870, partial [Selenomonas sp.]|nr:hypothetical protein [Selenomonas sp.]
MVIFIDHDADILAVIAVYRPVLWIFQQIVADKLLEQKAKYGPESLALLSPAGRDYKDISLRFLAVHGSPNHAHSG